MQFLVVDRRTLERGLIVKTPYVVVSIRDGGTRTPRIRRGSGLRGVLALAFDDAEPGLGFELPSDSQPMTLEQAEAIWQFVERHLGEIGAVVCQCEEGLRRAPAVAAALATALGQDPDEILADADPNEHVYTLMTAACSATKTMPES